MAANLKPLTPGEESRPCETEGPACSGGTHGRSKGCDQSSYFLGVGNGSLLTVSGKTETQPQRDAPMGTWGIIDGGSVAMSTSM